MFKICSWKIKHSTIIGGNFLRWVTLYLTLLICSDSKLFTLHYDDGIIGGMELEAMHVSPMHMSTTTVANSGNLIFKLLNICTYLIKIYSCLLTSS